MSFTLGLAQCRHPRKAGFGWQDAVDLARKWCGRAARHGVDLLVFPESLMTRYEAERKSYLEAAQTLDGPFCRALDALAAEYGMWIVYTVNEVNPDGLPFNTAVLVDGEGVQRGSYRKVHLFDSDFTQESTRMASGDRLFDPVQTPFGKIGISICYDLRFPEVARTAALAGCQVLVNPAAWVDGPLKADQWKALLAARAIENEIFVAGLSRVDEGRLGQSCIFGPDGALLASGGTDENLVCARIDLRRIETVRRAMPVFDHRRPDLYAL